MSTQSTSHQLRVVLYSEGGFWTACVGELDVFAEARGKLDALAKLHETLLIRAALTQKDSNLSFTANAVPDEQYAADFEAKWKKATPVRLALPDGYGGVFAYKGICECSDEVEVATA